MSDRQVSRESHRQVSNRQMLEMVFTWISSVSFLSGGAGVSGYTGQSVTCKKRRSQTGVGGVKGDVGGGNESWSFGRITEELMKNY